MPKRKDKTKQINYVAVRRATQGDSPVETQGEFSAFKQLASGLVKVSKKELDAQREAKTDD